ncbi:hypothetical protein HNQ07_000879 [Deinococcus metalli]|uniref:Uncharacterized protein n=1 Tax=Deinococcus metalli TaxID=1141878 RepID=A0A7W8KCJ9_9DEIO|nr:hypothetical protein [Deinococcus metalli]MBB5375435.1 hypothetical protein [Deinococcus metalli]GHF29303.1 hypothetical protein GCM10017781_01600 [Deinococcus metalli]
MTRPTDDASVGTALTDQQATDLHAKPGRGARHEPGAGEDTGEDATALEPDATHDRLDNDKDLQDEGGTRRR